MPVAKTVNAFKRMIFNFYRRLIAADRIVIAAPIFFMGINAQMKAIIDRMQPYWALKYRFRNWLLKTLNVSHDVDSFFLQRQQDFPMSLTVRSVL